MKFALATPILTLILWGLSGCGGSSTEDPLGPTLPTPPDLGSESAMNQGPAPASDPWAGPGCNRLVNADMEAGNQDWTGTAERQISQRAWLGKMAMIVSDGWIRQLIPAPPAGTRFTYIGAYYRDSGDTEDQFVGVGVDYLDASGNRLSQTFERLPATNNSYSRFEHSTTVPRDTRTMRVWISAGPQRLVTIDNLDFRRAGCQFEAQDGPFLNGPPEQIDQSVQANCREILQPDNDIGPSIPSTLTWADGRLTVRDNADEIDERLCELESRSERETILASRVHYSRASFTAHLHADGSRTMALFYRVKNPIAFFIHTRNKTLTIGADGRFLGCTNETTYIGGRSWQCDAVEPTNS